MDKYIGKLLDNRYEILEVIGTGGMAVVYKARCHRLNRLVAIKILKEDTTQDEELRRRFHAESQAVAMLSHPNIVSVFDVSRSSDADYIVMELIDGLTLKQYMQQKGVLNWREALHFAIQIAKALEHAHSRGIVHRDIKPHNIMVLKDGSVKVADFGIARITSSSNTLTREALGSVHYISPEQAKGGRVDERTDIYSLGVVLYEMLTAVHRLTVSRRCPLPFSTSASDLRCLRSSTRISQRDWSRSPCMPCVLIWKTGMHLPRNCWMIWMNFGKTRRCSLPSMERSPGCAFRQPSGSRGTGCQSSASPAGCGKKTRAICAA